jgi:hypothetical protein
MFSSLLFTVDSILLVDPQLLGHLRPLLQHLHPLPDRQSDPWRMVERRAKIPAPKANPPHHT